MSRDSAQFKVDQLLAGRGLGNTRYQRTALGSAVRFSSMLSLLDENSRSNTIVNYDSVPEALEGRLRDQTDEFNRAIGTNDPSLGQRTAQQEMQSRAYQTKLGRTIARETAYNASKGFALNQPAIAFGTSNTAKSFFGQFNRGDVDFFGTQTLYDNVFGRHADGDYLNVRDSEFQSEALTIDEDYGATASQKTIRGLVDASLMDVQTAIEQVDLEFTRFHGESLINQYSLTGSGLRSIRNTINSTQLLRGASTAAEKYRAIRSAGGNMMEAAKELQNNTDFIKATKALSELNVLYQNRSHNAPAEDIVNKAGVGLFTELFNSAKDKITIQTYQFQNDMASASLMDVVKRRVLERMLDVNEGGAKNPFVLDFIVAYPKNRTFATEKGDIPDNNQLIHKDTKGATGFTSFDILGPNLIEAMKLKTFQAELGEFLQNEIGIAPEKVSDLLQINVQFRDRKFHPKLYMSDTMAAIGTQNLTGPVGSSLNQAGSNFESMYVVRNKYTDDQLRGLRDNYRESGRDVLFEQSVNANRTDIRAAMLYRQIRALSDDENKYAGAGYEGYGISHRRGQVGLAGDIYEHLKQTLEFTHDYYFRKLKGSSSAAGAKQVVRGAGQGGAIAHRFNMFFILDQTFLLQMNNFAKQNRGEMGEDFSGNIYKENDARAVKYRDLQNKTFDLLVSGAGKVTVDTTNYQQGIVDPIIEKIRKNADLNKKFMKAGMNLGLMAGYNIFGPKTAEQTDSSVNAMITFLRAQGFDNENFTESELKEIIALGSGNIKLATAPRQHTKSYGLIDYARDAATGAAFNVKNKGARAGSLVSYYLGSSNLGMYSLGIPAGRSSTTADFRSVNTEMGVMLGRDLSADPDIDDYISFRRDDIIKNRTENQLPQEINKGNWFRPDDEWALTQEMEQDALLLAQQRFVLTHSELGNNQIYHPELNSIKNTPLWMSNVDSGGLMALKSRLERLRSDMGLTGSAFTIIDRLAEDGSIKSINVTINLATVLGEKGFMNASSNMPKMNFELSVLQGPNRGQDYMTERAGDNTKPPGFVYFVDKNKVVGNGLFVNESHRAVEVFGRQNYDDAVKVGSDLDDGRISLGVGQSAHMSSLDVTTQLFGSMITEGIYRPIEDSMYKWRAMTEQSRRDVGIEYLSKALFGTGTHMGAEETIDGIAYGRDVTAEDVLLKYAGFATNQELIGLLSAKLFGTNRIARGEISSRESYGGLTDVAQIRTMLEGRAGPEGLTASQKNKLDAYKNFANEFSKFGKAEGQQRVEQLQFVRSAFSRLIQYSPELIPEVMKYGTPDTDFGRQQAAYKEYVAGLFDPFLQAREERTYGGQQAFYKTLQLGIASPKYDNAMADMMADLDPSKEGQLGQGYAYARIQALNYSPLTELYEHMYRAINANVTAGSGANADRDSLLFEDEARRMGDAANLRLMESIGIGTKLDADTYLRIDSNNNIALSEDYAKLISSMQAVDGGIPVTAEMERLKQVSKDKLLQSAVDTFDYQVDARGNITIGKDTVMQFYTGGKLAQLPQRIKNAMGARPMWQFGVAAQRLTEGFGYGQSTYGSYAHNKYRVTTVADLSSAYIKDYRAQVERIIQKRSAEYLGIAATEPDLDERIRTADAAGIEGAADKLAILNRVSSNLFRDKAAGLGAVFTGRIKTILSQEQHAAVEAKKAELLQIFKTQNEDEERLFREALRVEIIKMSLSSQGLGKMIAGNDRMRFSIALIQLNGSYTDTFLANPTYGTIYTSEQKAKDIQYSSITDTHIKDGTVLAKGQREGYVEEQSKSIKGSMIGAGGFKEMTQAGDRIVELSTVGTVFDGYGNNTGRYVLQRYNKSTGRWEVVRTKQHKITDLQTGEVIYRTDNNVPDVFLDSRRYAVESSPGAPMILDEKRHLRSISNIVDNTAFSPFGKGANLGAVVTTNYGRAGEKSVDEIFMQDWRNGNFTNNDYIQNIIRLRSVIPGGGRRVEGTDSSALIKGVANFASDVVHQERDADGKLLVNRKLNTFESLVFQARSQFDSGEVGGTLGYLIQNERIFGDMGDQGYAPLSSMIHGLYNTNNFKSFFWSHGAKILTARSGRDGMPAVAGDHFLVEALFDKRRMGQDASRLNMGENVLAAKRMMGGLMMAFGDEFLGEAGDPRLKSMQRGLVDAMLEGQMGEMYRRMAVAQSVLMVNSLGREGLQKKMAKHGGDQAAFQAEMKNMLYSEIKQKSGVFQASNLGALRGINAEHARVLMTSSESAEVGMAADAIMKQVQLIVDKGVEGAKEGYMTLGGQQGFFNRQAAAVVTAIDMFQQMSAQREGMRLPTDIDFSSEKMQQILLGIGGVNLSQAEEEEYLQMVMGMSTQINMVSVFTDISFSMSKDPTGTQSVARHEGQHLIMPYLSNIQEFQKGGQLDRIQHTMASLISLVTDTKGGIAVEGRLGIKNFGRNRALNLRDSEAAYMFSPWVQQRFLGFYQSGGLQGHTQPFVANYKRYALALSRYEGGSNWLGSQFAGEYKDAEGKVAYTWGDEVDQFLKQNYPRMNEEQRQRARTKIEEGGADRFAIMRLEQMEGAMAGLAQQEATNQFKTVGVDSTKEYLQRMTNKTMFFGMPEITFSRENGAIVARATQRDIYTFIPSAELMKNLGAQHQDFIDPLVQNYKALSTLFTPGHIASKALQKLLNSGSSGTVLNNTEANALMEAMKAAVALPTEVQKAVGSQRIQEAGAGKVKYGGFTSTGIGSLMAPASAVYLAQSKLNEAGLGEMALREGQINRAALIEEIMPSLKYTPSPNTMAVTSTDAYDKALIELSEKTGFIMGNQGEDGKWTYDNQRYNFIGDFQILRAGTEIATDEALINKFEGAIKDIQKLRMASIYQNRATSGILPEEAKLNAISILDKLDYAYDLVTSQRKHLKEGSLRMQQLDKLRNDIQSLSVEFSRAVEVKFGIRKQVTKIETGVFGLNKSTMKIVGSEGQRNDITRTIDEDGNVQVQFKGRTVRAGYVNSDGTVVRHELLSASRKRSVSGVRGYIFNNSSGTRADRAFTKDGNEIFYTGTGYDLDTEGNVTVRRSDDGLKIAKGSRVDRIYIANDGRRLYQTFGAQMQDGVIQDSRWHTIGNMKEIVAPDGTTTEVMIISRPKVDADTGILQNPGTTAMEKHHKAVVKLAAVLGNYDRNADGSIKNIYYQVADRQMRASYSKRQRNKATQLRLAPVGDGDQISRLVKEDVLPITYSKQVPINQVNAFVADAKAAGASVSIGSTSGGRTTVNLRGGQRSMYTVYYKERDTAIEDYAKVSVDGDTTKIEYTKIDHSPASYGKSVITTQQTTTDVTTVNTRFEEYLYSKEQMEGPMGKALRASGAIQSVEEIQIAKSHLERQRNKYSAATPYGPDEESRLDVTVSKDRLLSGSPSTNPQRTSPPVGGGPVGIEYGNELPVVKNRIENTGHLNKEDYIVSAYRVVLRIDEEIVEAQESERLTYEQRGIKSKTFETREAAEAWVARNHSAVLEAEYDRQSFAYRKGVTGILIRDGKQIAVTKSISDFAKHKREQVLAKERDAKYGRGSNSYNVKKEADVSGTDPFSVPKFLQRMAIELEVSPTEVVKIYNDMLRTGEIMNETVNIQELRKLEKQREKTFVQTQVDEVHRNTAVSPGTARWDTTPKVPMTAAPRDPYDKFGAVPGRGLHPAVGSEFVGGPGIVDEGVRDYHSQKRIYDRVKNEIKNLYRNKYTMDDSDITIEKDGTITTRYTQVDPSKPGLLTAQDKRDKQTINAIYQRQITALQQGISDDMVDKLDIYRREALQIKNSMADITSRLNQIQRGSIIENRIGGDIRNLMRFIRDRKRDVRATKKASGDKEGDKFVYAMVESNLEAIENQLRLALYDNFGSKLSEEHVAQMRRTADRFSNTNFILNSTGDFSGLGVTQGRAAELTEMEMVGKLRGSLQTDIKNGTNNIISHLNQFDTMYGSTDKMSPADRAAFNKQIGGEKSGFVQQRISEVIQSYKDEKATLESHITRRSNVNAEPNGERSPETLTESQRIAHEGQLNRYDALIGELESTLQEVKQNSSHNSNHYTQSLNRMQNAIYNFDTGNATTVEFFRSPTPGGTDPRALTFAAMAGVAALEKVHHQVENIAKQDSSKSPMTSVMHFDQSRNVTATYIGAIGMITYGGGDFDGDPYTAIFNKVSNHMQKYLDSKANLEIAERKKRVLGARLAELNKNEAANAIEIKRVEDEIAKADKAAKIYGKRTDKLLAETKQRRNEAIDDINGRTRREVANYLGVDEKYFMRVDKGGFADITYDADALHAYLNTGYGLFDGINQGAKSVNIKRNIQGLLGYGSKDYQSEDERLRGYSYSRRAYQLLKNLHANRLSAGQNANEEITVDGTPGRTRRGDAQEHILRSYLRERVANLGEGAGNEDYTMLRYLVDEASSEEMKAMAASLGEAIQTRNNYLTLNETMGDLEAAGQAGHEARLLFMNQFIGGQIMNTITAHDSMKKLMGLSSSDDVDGSTFDLLTKSLGKAGGVILGKVYNTIIGTTFQDAPLISLASSMKDKDSALRAATEDYFYKRQMVASSDKKYENVGHVNQITAEMLEEAKANDDIMKTNVNNDMNKYIQNSEAGLAKMKASQAMMKNVHQILRDSIKLKGNAEAQKALLKEKSATYNSIYEEISRMDRSDYDSQQEYSDARAAKQEEAEKILSEMASSMGPGMHGLRSLENMDYVINKSGKNGIGAAAFASRFFDVESQSETEKSRLRLAFNALGNQGNRDTDGVRYDQKAFDAMMNGRLDVADESTRILMNKLVHSQISLGQAGLITAYRMGNILDHGQAEGRVAATGRAKDFAQKSQRRIYQQDVKGQLTDLAYAIPSNVSAADLTVDQQNAKDEVNRVLNRRYLDKDAALSADDYQGRQALMIVLEQDGRDISSYYDSEGNLKLNSNGDSFLKIDVEKTAAKSGLSTDEYLAVFDSHWQHSRETISNLYGKDGSRIANMAGLENMRKAMMSGFAGQDSVDDFYQKVSGTAVGALMKNMDTEITTTMAQLISQNKLGSEGVHVMAKLFTGVAETIMSSQENQGTFAINRVVRNAETGEVELDKNGNPVTNFNGAVTFEEMTVEERKMLATREIYRSLYGSSNDPTRKSEAGQSIGKETADMMDDDNFLRALVESQEGTLSQQEAKLLEQMSTELLAKTMEDDESFDKLLDQFLPDSDAKYTAEGRNRETEKKNIRRHVHMKQSMFRVETAQEQSLARKRMNQVGNVIRRGAFMRNIDEGTASLLATNKVANSLDLLVPLAITAFGQAISDGSVDGNDLQMIGGAALSSFSYIRPNLLDETTNTNLQRRQMMTRGLTSVFKFRNAVARQDGNYGMAAVDMTIREGTAMFINGALAPKLNNYLTKNTFGATATMGVTAIDMNKYKATQQLAGNVGSSLIAAASSTLISGLLMKHTVKPAMQSVAQSLQSFQPAVDYQASVNENIAARRAQQNAYETMVTLETNDNDDEISTYNVLTSSTYSPYDQNSSEDLQGAVELEPDGLGGVSFG